MEYQTYHDHHLQFQNPFSKNPNMMNAPKEAMEKFREIVMKLCADSDPSNKTLIEAHLTKFVSDFHTPNHPPYAAMIDRAIQELNEKEGSTEESISQYIKNHYTDLPWAHSSLLKHHLGKLCECGDILVTHKQFYSLAGANPNLETPITPKQEHLKRKPKGKSKRGRHRPRKKDETEEGDILEEEHQEVIGEHTMCNQEQDELTGEHNEIKESNIDMVAVLGEQNRVPKLPDEVIEKQIESDEQHEVVGSEAYDQQIGMAENGEHDLINDLIEGQSQPQRQEIRISMEHGQTVISAEQSHPQQKQEGNGICVSLVDLNMQMEHLEKQNLPELSTPERPPGFEFATFKEASQSEEQQTKDLLDQEQCEVLPNSEMFSEFELPTIKDLSETSEQIQEVKRLSEQLKCEGQNPCPESAPSAIMMEVLLLHHQQQQPELSNTEVVKPIDVELLEQSQPLIKQYCRRKHMKSQTKERKTQDVSVDSEHIKQKQQSDLSNPENSTEPNLTIVESFTLEKRQQLEMCGEQEATESQTEAIKQQQLEICGEQPAPESQTEAIKQQQLEIYGEQPAPHPRIGAIVTSDLQMDLNKLDKEEKPDESVPGSPMELQKVTVKSPAQKPRQGERRSPRLASKQTATSSVDNDMGKSELQVCELLPQEKNQKPVKESTHHLTKQQAKLLSGQKRNSTFQPRSEMASIKLDFAEPEQLDESTQAQREKFRSWRKRYNTAQSNSETVSLDSSPALEQVDRQEQPEIQCSQGKSPGMKLRSRTLK